jgi:multidrug efflux pump subunit AcrB/outer membrane protein TolC
MRLAGWSVNRPTLVWLLVAAITGWGVHNYLSMSRREDPEIKISIALVVTIWPGKGAEDVERLVTRKLEDRIEQMSSLEELRSTTRENVSLIFVDVRYDADEQLEWQKLRNRIEEARPELPAGVIGPTVIDDFGDVTAMVWALRSRTAEPRELKEWAERFKERLKTLPAVGKVNLVGDQQEVIYIEGPMDSFSMYGFSPFAAAKVLDLHNVNVPAGYLHGGERDVRLDASGTFTVLEELREAVLDVSRDTGLPLRVRDVFGVRRAYEEPRRHQVLSNGDPAVALDVRMQRGFNVVALGEQVRAQAEEFRRELPPGVKLDLLHDQPREVDEFINEFMNNLWEGVLLVILVMLLPMGIRNTSIVAVALPLSIVVTFAVMPLFDVMLEQVAIAAFIVVIGMLVDDAIIVVDNVDVHLRRGLPPREAAVYGANEIALPMLTGGTLATVFAFLPLLLLTDEMGAYVRSLPLVVSIGMMASFFVAMFVTPLMAAHFLKPSPPEELHDPARPSRVRAAYAWVMRAGMRGRWLVVLLALAAFAGALRLIPTVGLSFFPRVDRDQFTIDVWTPEGSGLDRTLRTVNEVEAVLRQEPQVKDFVAYVGEGGPRFHITVVPQFNTLNYARFMVITRDKDATRALVERLRVVFRERVAGAHVLPSAILMGKPVEAPIAIKIHGPDLSVARRISMQVQAILRETPGADMVRDNLGQEVASLDVVIDQEAAHMAGVSNSEVAAALLTAHEGFPVTDFRAEDRRIPVRMRATAEEREGLQGLKSLWVPSQATGEKVPLGAFASLTPRWAPGVIHHVDGHRAVTVLSDVHGRLAFEVLRDAWPRISALELPRGYQVVSEGEEKERNKAFGQLLFVFGVIMAALVVMLVIQFGSVKRALAILCSVPLAIVGAVLGLWWSGNSFSFMAFLGVVSLAGIVIKNAVLWVDHADRSLANGMSLAEAVVEAGARRVRPIMMTALTTVGGLIPLALFGGVLWEGMAWAMIVGLSLATVLTLFVIPIIYYLMFRRRGARRREALARGGAGQVTTAGLALLAGLAGLLGAPSPARAEHQLEALLKLAEARSVANREAALGVGEARNDRQQALASFAPMVDGTASASRLDRSMQFTLDTSTLNLPITLDLPPMTLVNRDVYRVGVTVTVPLVVGGKRLALLDAAGSGIRARERVQEATHAQVAFGVAARYVQVLEAARHVRNWEARLKADQRLAFVARAKAERGLGVPFDVQYAETIAADSERRLEVARGQEALARARLNDLAGREPGAAIVLQEVGFDPAFAPDLNELRADLDQRPELQAHAEKARALELKVKAARSDLLPTVALLGEGGYKHGDLGYTGGDGYWIATAALKWNLAADAGAWVRQARARLEVTRARVEQEGERRRLDLALTEAHRQHADVTRVYGVALRAVETARAGYRNARAAYDQGVLPLTTLVEATRALVDATGNLTAATYGRALAELQLRQAAGLPLLSPPQLNPALPDLEFPAESEPR